LSWRATPRTSRPERGRYKPRDTSRPHEPGPPFRS
jgi:hypothetical protein